MSAQRLKGRTIVVAGAGGFIGARIVLALVAEGARVRALVRSGRTPRLDGVPNLETIRCPLEAREALVTAAADADAVVNAAYDFLGDGAALLSSFDNLLTAVREGGAKAFIQLSSIAVYDDWPAGALTEDCPKDGPGSLYKTIKRDMERRLHASGIPYTILQPTIVYGPGGWQWTDRTIEQLKTGVVILPDGDRGLCHAVYVDDVTSAAVSSVALAQQPNGSFIVSGPAPVTWLDFFAGYAALVGAPPPRLEPMSPSPDSGAAGAAPSLLRAQAVRIAKATIGEGGLAALRGAAAKLKSGGRPVEHWPKGPMIELYAARGAISTERARSVLGWAPKIDFEEGLARIKADYRL
jgi:nucleoside-diphosphate-sugar epimerase